MGPKSHKSPCPPHIVSRELDELLDQWLPNLAVHWDYWGLISTDAWFYSEGLGSNLV